ncbi:MAG: carbon-nitrogen hydrolase family protein [Corynebacterium sp.]|nr:carbon-nitrogen hydrolase family protein [Corynebacterium sp.]
MKVAAVQFVSSGDKQENLDYIVQTLREAAANGAQLIVFPEAASQAFDTGRLDTQAEEIDGPFATTIAQEAQQLGVTVVVGMFRPADQVERDGETINRVFNTALIAGPNVHTKYDKIYTYDAFDYRESDTVQRGTDPVTFTVDGITVGVATCFDIRFPELFKTLSQQGAEVIVVPTSWADGPGKLEQWKTLTAARALDCVSYIVGVDQARPGGLGKAGEQSGPTGVGHSVICSPRGERIAEAGYLPEIVYADIDPELVIETRKALPVLELSR